MSLLAQGAIVIGAAVLSVALLWAARRGPWNERFAVEVTEHSKAFDFMGTAFAVLLAFVVIQAYDSYNEAKSGAEEEAEAVLQLSRTVEAFAPQEHERLEGLLVCYGRAVIHHGWSTMQKDEEGSPVVNEWGTRFREETVGVEIRSYIQRANYRQLLVEQDVRIDGRRTRLAEAIRTVPTPMWLVLLLGAGLTIGWVVLGANRRGSFLVQASVVASVTAMVTAALLLVWFFDHPFAGESGSIRPVEMEHTLETIAEEEEDQAVEVTPPCTPHGGRTAGVAPHPSAEVGPRAPPGACSRAPRFSTNWTTSFREGIRGPQHHQALAAPRGAPRSRRAAGVGRAVRNRRAHAGYGPPPRPGHPAGSSSARPPAQGHATRFERPQAPRGAQSLSSRASSLSMPPWSSFRSARSSAIAALIEPSRAFRDRRPSTSSWLATSDGLGGSYRSRRR